MKYYILILFSLLMMASCASSYQSKGEKDRDIQTENSDYNIALDLTERLKTYAGLRVMGQGARATISLRRVSAFCVADGASMSISSLDLLD